MSKRPNILMIMADQLRADSLGCFGNKEIRTPNLDRLAIQGTCFDQHYCQAPVCMPSRASVFTGRYPKNNGVRDNGIPLRDSEVCFPEVLREGGYHTVAVGKMHLTSMLVPKANEHDDWPQDRYGFDVLHTTTDSKDGAYLAWLKDFSPENYAIVKKQGEDKVREDTAAPADKQQTGAPQVKKNELDPAFHQSTWIAEKTMEEVDAAGDKPFFIFTSFVDPHHPFDPPEPYASMYDPSTLELPKRKPRELEDKPPHFRMHECGQGFSNEKYDYRKLSDEEWRQVKAAYYGMITLMDDQIGRILAHLEEKGILDNTLIFFTADHGELLGDHGLLFKGPFHYDAIIRVPLIMRWPIYVPQGSRFTSMSEHVDLMPTVLEAARCDVPYGTQGLSLLPSLIADGAPNKAYALTEFHAMDWGLKLKTLTSPEYKLTYYANRSYGELYDRVKDPNEFVNEWDNPSYAEIKEKLLRDLMDRIINTEDPLPIRIGKY